MKSSLAPVTYLSIGNVSHNLYKAPAFLRPLKHVVVYIVLHFYRDVYCVPTKGTLSYLVDLSFWKPYQIFANYFNCVFLHSQNHFQYNQFSIYNIRSGQVGSSVFNTTLLKHRERIAIKTNRAHHAQQCFFARTRSIGKPYHHSSRNPTTSKLLSLLFRINTCYTQV